MIFKIFRSASGAALVEAVLVLAGVIMPILLAATSLAEVLDARAKLQLAARNASRSFVLADSNTAGFLAVEQLVQSQQNLFNAPLQIFINCKSNCAAGDVVQASAKVKVTLISVPYMPDLSINLAADITTILDRYIER